jgi:hypothetical protein
MWQCVAANRSVRLIEALDVLFEPGWIVVAPALSFKMDVPLVWTSFSDVDALAVAAIHFRNLKRGSNTYFTLSLFGGLRTFL